MRPAKEKQFTKILYCTVRLQCDAGLCTLVTSSSYVGWRTHPTMTQLHRAHTTTLKRSGQTYSGDPNLVKKDRIYEVTVREHGVSEDCILQCPCRHHPKPISFAFLLLNIMRHRNMQDELANLREGGGGSCRHVHLNTDWRARKREAQKVRGGRHTSV